jgi:hypothetical protein
MFSYWSTQVRLALALLAIAASAPAQNDWKFSPTVDEPIRPLSLKHKFYLFSYRTVEPSAWGKSLFTAGIAQWGDSPPEWGQGMEGFGKRYGHRVLNRAVENAIGFGVAVALREDGRYYRRPRGTVVQRIGNALSQTVTTRTTEGNLTFPGWRLAGNFGAQFVSNAWRPESQRGAGDTMLRGTISISYDAAANVFKEFWPDIRRKLFRRP